MLTCSSSDCSNDKVNGALIKGLDIRIVAVAALTKRLYPSLKVDRGKIGKGARRKGDTGETLKGKNRLSKFQNNSPTALRTKLLTEKIYLMSCIHEVFSSAASSFPSLSPLHNFKLGFRPICVSAK